ncbi:MAG: FlgD immunoglobulin-like domain containing protein [Saprospiraceae bacterium]
MKERFPDHAGTLKWLPPFDYVSDRVYFWRVSTDSISPEQPFLWSKRSFIYKPGTTNGWNQSHFHQLTDNILDTLVADSTARIFNFERKSKNYRMVNRYHDVPQGLVPYFFEDGKFNAKLAQTFRNSDIHGFVVAIDSITGNYFMNPPGGLYGSLGLAIPMEGFAYNLTTAQGRQDMINLIENVIPTGYYVFFYTYQHTGFPDYHPEQWAADEQVFGKSIFTTIEAQFPSSGIRTLATTGSVPYIILFQKDKGIIKEEIGANIDDVISISFDGGSFLTSGSFTTDLIGPASKWYSIENNIETLLDTAGYNILSAWALNKEQTDTLWIAHDINDPSLDISHVNAALYPYIQLSLATSDSSDYKPSSINYWRVLFDGRPEFEINPDHEFVYQGETLDQGQRLFLATSVENISAYHADSIPVSLKIIAEDNTTEELIYQIPSLDAHSSVRVEFEKITNEMTGDYRLLLDVNVGEAVKETNKNNNIGILPLRVNGDGLNPILDVTFDGHHILDGDLVASKPLIVIELHDENEYLRLDDTTSFAMFLEFPSDVQPRRISFTEDWVQFNEASSTGQNIATVELRPELLEDGLYTLEVKALDANGNLSGENNYRISFEVINAKSVSHIYNYPNPFSTSTRFVYTLTGEGSPPYYKIQIMSISGQVVREITHHELGPLKVGTHMTDYVWDGTDESGGKLSAGTYLYRMIVKKENLEEYDRYETSNDNTFFKKGWGKLVILR